MRAELLEHLRAVMLSAPVAKSPVTPATPVTPPVLAVTEPVTEALDVETLPVTVQRGYRSRARELQALHALRVKTGKGRHDDCSPLTALGEVDEAAIEERAGLAADVPAVFLDGWSRLNCQRPFGVSEAAWRLALDDGGRFLDAFGEDAAALGWTASEIFDVMAGLIWQLGGERVEAIGEDGARLSGGLLWRKRIVDRAG